METTPQESALVVAMKELHGMASKELNGEGGDSFLSIIVENDKVATGFYGKPYSIGYGIVHTLTKNPDVVNEIKTEVMNAPGFLSSVILFLLEQDTDNISLSEEERAVVAAGLRELATKIETRNSHAEDTVNEA